MKTLLTSAAIGFALIGVSLAPTTAAAWDKASCELNKGHWVDGGSWGYGCTWGSTLAVQGGPTPVAETDGSGHGGAKIPTPRKAGAVSGAKAIPVSGSVTKTAPHS